MRNWTKTVLGDGKDMVIRQKIFQTITDVFKRHGGVTIDTPVFELRVMIIVLGVESMSD